MMFLNLYLRNCHEVWYYLFIMQFIWPLNVKELEIIPGINTYAISTRSIDFFRKSKLTVTLIFFYKWGILRIRGSLGFAGAPWRNACLKYSDSE